MQTNAKYGKTYPLMRQINEYSPNEDSSFTTLTPKQINKSSITFGYHIYITYNSNNTKTILILRYKSYNNQHTYFYTLTH